MSERIQAHTPSYWHLTGLVLILIAVGWLGYRDAGEAPARSWFAILGLLVLFALVVAHGVTGYWRGLLIDSRNKISLSRLQMLAWTFVVMSALLVSALVNVAAPDGWQTPLDITIPPELWIAMGISSASLVASPAMLTQRSGQPEPAETTKNLEALAAQGYEGLEAPKDMVVRYASPRDAKWADLFRGEEYGNCASLDLAKLQMFFITFIILFSYATAIGAMLSADEVPILEFPKLEDGLVTLIGISHTAYLANKAVPHTPKG